MQRKYPLGIQTFSEIREVGYVYVDKTEQIDRVVSAGKYYFLSRPRRFGKSLTLSTMHDLYRGRKELFTGLWAEKNWDWTNRKRPVVWLKFSSYPPLEYGLSRAIHDMMNDQAAEHGLDIGDENTSVGNRFRSLLQQLSARDGKVVVLVDEYDKPLIDVIENVEVIDKRREILKSFYAILKDADPYLELVFITGVSAFARVSIFSDLNNLTYLTLHERAATLVGITQQELYDTFAPELETVDKAELRRWYNGYSWNGRDFVYNPWSVLSFMDQRRIANYWFLTGTPTFLVKLMKSASLYKLPQFEGDVVSLTTFDPAAPDLLPLLFQTGYLTVKTPPDSIGWYELDYPNLEVRESLDRMLLAGYTSAPAAASGSRSANLIRAFQRGDLDAVRDAINATLASIPYDHWKGQNEFFFHVVTYLLFRLAGVHLETEVHSAKGRADLVVATSRAVYVIELKVDEPASTALTQVMERGYLQPYLTDARPKYAVAATFSSETKQLENWVVGLIN